MKNLSVVILPIIIIFSCTLPVSVEEINTIPECENTKLVKEYVKYVRGVSVYIGLDQAGYYGEFNIEGNYFIGIDGYRRTCRYNLCQMISARLSEDLRDLDLFF